MAEKAQAQRLRFADFTIDTGSRLLSQAGQPVDLAPKEFQTLLLLAQAAPQAVEREALIRAIWPDTIVGDTSLGRNISVLRRHLGSDAIKSVAKFGYRLMPEVTVVEDEPPASPAAITPQPALISPPWTARPQWTLRLVTAAAVIALVLLAVSIFRSRVYGASVNPEAAQAAERWDEMGMFALREGTYFKASKAFAQAVALNPHAALAHAHLAEAALQLQQVDQAQREVLLASDRSRVRDLTEQQQLYLEAVRATVVHDYPTATHAYETILANLPDSEKSNGLEDLGRAYQTEGRIPEAIQSYEQAARLQPANAGAQLHLAILKSLQRDQPAANAYLDRATALYDASTNLEGVAEVTLQRALMAYVRADYRASETYLQSALELAIRIDNPQLQARVLGSLSTVQRWDGKLAEGQESAVRMAQVSRDAAWDFGDAEAVLLEANIAVAEHDVPRSRELLKQGLALAMKIKHPRVEANAEFSIADLDGHLGEYDQEIEHARRALAFYQSYGSIDGVADASRLVIDGEIGKRELTQALSDAQALLATSERTHSDLFIEDTEEQLGDIYTAMEDDPSALIHYGRARELSQRTGSEVPLKSLDVAGSLARLGYVEQARSILNATPVAARTDPDTMNKYEDVRVKVEVAQAHYAAALAIARKAQSIAMAPAASVDLAEAIASSEARLGQKSQAQHDANELLAAARKTNNGCRLAHAELTAAMVALSTQAPQTARDMAHSANAYFTERSMRESEWLALLYEAEAMHALGDAKAAARALEARAVLADMQKQWPPEHYRAYMARPDIRQSLQALNTLTT